MTRLSVIIPVQNEAKNLEELIGRLRASTASMPVSADFLFIDDGSTDHTLEILRTMAKEHRDISFISFTRNFGHQVAIQAGLEHCRGDYIVIMDGDLQDPPEIIPDFFNRMKDDNAEVVYGKRRTRKKESFLKRWTAAFFYRVLNRLSHIDIPVDTGDFRLITAAVAEQLRLMKEPNKFLRGQVTWTGYRQSFVEYDREGRKEGESHFSYRKMISFAIDGITGFSHFPLKFATLSGIMVSMISFLLIAWVLIAKFIWHQTISGWTSIMVTILFLGGIQLLSIGIIGEYISRINDATRQRPLYVIRESSKP